MAREVVSVESRIEQVTVYAHGARVRRVASLRGPLPSVVRFAGLPLAVIDDTVRCEVEGAGVVTAIRVGVDTPSGEPRGEESDELRAARQRVALAESEVERLHGALEKLAAAPLIEDDPSDDPPAAWAAIVAARRELVALRAKREQALRETLAAALHEQDEAHRALEVVREREHKASTAKAARLHEVRKHAELDLAGAGDITVRVEYQVTAARWAPSYVARLEGEHARFELRAVVAQSSGEDWTDVALRLSTAEPERFAQLPELHPQKIGRRQHEPAKRGFRAPPTGVDVFYTDYDRSFPRRIIVAGPEFDEDDSMYEGRAPAPPSSVEQPELAEVELSKQVWDEETSKPRERYAAPPPVGPPLAKKSGMIGAISGAVAGTIAAPFALAAQAMTRNAPGGGRADVSKARGHDAPSPLLDYGNLRMAAASAAQRGTLVPAPRELDLELASRVEAGISTIEQLPLPPGHFVEWAHNYDYAFTGDGKVEINSDAAWHSLALTARAGTAKIRHVAVPREQADVFRVAAITNPFEGPLLPGPIDIYDRGQFLVTSEVDYTPPGGEVDIGLGVDPTVKIARNVEFHEEASGMLRGALRLVHAISIDVENLAGRPIELEVRERVPVTREGDDDIEVSLGKVEPPWERYTPDTDAPRDVRLRGGYRWQLTLPAATKKLLRAGYEVKIAGKHELVGGNRREP
ncbi:MAG TPA: mucoidy inhibitor MuiA family protein [Kofleriaceae bacterium]